MAAPNTITNPTSFTAQVSFLSTVSLPAGCVDNTAVKAGASGNYVAASKLQHQQNVHYTQENGTTIATEKKEPYIQYGATGTLLAVEVANTGTVGSGGGMSVTVDVLKSTGGGAFASVLSAVVTINASTTIRTAVAGSISGGTNALVAGDILQVSVTATAGGGTLPKGLSVNLVISTDPA